MTTLRCWEVEHSGITAKVFSTGRGKARYLVAQSIVEAGFANTIGEAMVEMKCRRAKEHDAEAIICGKETVR